MISSDTVQSTAQTWKEHKPRKNLDTFAEAEGLDLGTFEGSVGKYGGAGEFEQDTGRVQ